VNDVKIDVKIVFRTYIRQKSINLNQTKAKMISNTFYTSTFHLWKLFLVIMCNL